MAATPKARKPRKLKRCPDCTVVLQAGDGPNQLAEHLCHHIDEERLQDMRVEILDLIGQPDLTREQALSAMYRLCLAKAIEKGVSISDVRELLGEMNGAEPAGPARRAPATAAEGTEGSALALLGR